MAQTISVRVRDRTRWVTFRFSVTIRPLNRGVEIVLDDEGIKLAQQVTNLRKALASSKKRRLKYGFTVDGHEIGDLGELSVAVVTGLPWIALLSQLNSNGKDPDCGRTLQVRATAKHTKLCLHEDDPDYVPWLLVKVCPPNKCVVYGWAWGREVKQQQYWGDHWGHNQPCYALDAAMLHHLSELPEDNTAWLYATYGDVESAEKQKERDAADLDKYRRDGGLFG